MHSKRLAMIHTLLVMATATNVKFCTSASKRVHNDLYSTSKGNSDSYEISNYKALKKYEISNYNALFSFKLWPNHHLFRNILWVVQSVLAHTCPIHIQALNRLHWVCTQFRASITVQPHQSTYSRRWQKYDLDCMHSIKPRACANCIYQTVWLFLTLKTLSTCKSPAKYKAYF